MNKEIKIPDELSGLFYKYNDKFLIEDSLPDIEVVLVSLYVIEYFNKKSGAKIDEIKEFFTSIGRKERPNFYVAIHNAKKRNLIEYQNSTILFLIKGLKRIRDLLGQIGKTPVHIIKSGQNFSAIRLFEEFLNYEIKGNEIKLCDSHISPSTLFPFSNLKNKKIKILTSNIYDAEKLNDYIKKMKKEGIDILIKENMNIHDRFLINNDKCWHLGASIKDLGNKDTIIKEISEVYDSMDKLFEERWKE